MLGNKKIEALKKQVEALEKQVAELKQSLDKILNTLEGDKFLEDWKLFKNWPIIKEEFPELKLYIKLKELKLEMGVLRSWETGFKGDNRQRIEIKSQQKRCFDLIQDIEKETKTQKIDSKELLLWFGLSTNELEKIMDDVFRKETSKD